jgi:hypothetical protein
MWRRWLALAVLVVAVSGAAAWVSWSAMSGPNTLGQLAFPAPPKPTGPPGTVILEPAEETVDFGVMNHHDKTLQSWVIKNGGPGDLVLTGDQPYCSCTVVSLKPGEQKTLKPGETFTVEVEYEAKALGDADKSARIFTSDPKREELVFRFKGKVYPVIVTLPEEGHVDAGTIPNTESRRIVAAISAPSRPETKILEMIYDHDRFDIVAGPLTDDEKRRANLETGEHLEITVKPTARLGYFNEEIIIKTDHPLKDEVKLTIGGKVVGPITATPTVLRLPDVTPRGRTADVTLWVVGQDQTHFTVEAPQNLKATVTPADDTKGASKSAGGHRYRMTVTVPPGTPPGVIDDPIVLKTDHPHASEFKLPVQITVLGEG